MKWAMMLLWMTTTLAFAEQDKSIPVPHDPNAQHVLLHKSGKSTHRVVITKRTGLSGELYSKRTYNCDRRTVKLLSSGFTLESLEQNRNDWLEDQVSMRSVSGDISMEACSDS